MASPLPIVLAVLVAGLLLQLGVNLINDRTDLHLLNPGDPQTECRRQGILLSFRLGLVSFAVAVVIGLALVFARGWELLVIGVLGVFGAFAYTTEPFNYKRRGLSLLLLIPIARHLYAEERVPLPPWTGRLLLVFTFGYALAL